ncbi:MAG: hypothetical protein IJC25_04930, partial [Clostridia bacterium]|nr:hypothetical protein [Clostridia bacterium]
MKKRIAAFLLSLILLCNCGLDQNDLIDELLPEPTVTPVSSMSLSFHASKTLDPFGLTSALNLQIGKLAWEPLFARGADQSALPVLAAGLQQRDALNWYVSLNAQRVFWDGSAVTAADVVFSYQKALQSSEYSHIKNSIVSLTAEGDGVLVTLTRPNIYCYALLDFPIVKKDDYPKSEGGQAQNSIPVVHYLGTGLYRPVYEDDRVSLQLNGLHPNAASANVKTVLLEDTPDFAAMNSAIATQLSDGGYSDLTGGLKPSVSGNVFGVAQNNMVYLGIVQKGAMANAELRKAVSLTLNRTLLNSFYSGYAVSAVTPFHPSFYAAQDKICTNLKSDPKAAAQLVSALGDLGRLKLVYSSDNPVSTELAAEITRQLTEAGLHLDCVGLSGSDYRTAVSAGSCDL